MTVTLIWNDEQDVVSIDASHIAMLEKLLTEAAKQENVAQGEVSLSFVDDEAIRQLNKEYRNKDQATDVLSFPMEENEDEHVDEAGLLEMDDPTEAWDDSSMPVLLGDIIISVPTALRQSEEYGHSLNRELGFLFVHGFLHLIGYDHETKEEEQEMFARQEAILQAAGLMRA